LIIIGAVGTFCSIAFGAVLILPVKHPYAVSIETLTDRSTSTKVFSRMPVEIMIPAIMVDASIESVGLTASGSIGVPSNPSNAAWFNQSIKPGDRGTSIIVGHSGWNNGRSVAFDDLKKVNIGDKIYIRDEDGSIGVFIVTRLQTLGENEDYGNEFDQNDGDAHLSLITCSGIWSNASKTYSDRLIIFSNKV